MKVQRYLEYIRTVLLETGKDAREFDTYMKRELRTCFVVLSDTPNNSYSLHFKGFRHLIDFLYVMTAPYERLGQTTWKEKEKKKFSYVTFSHTPEQSVPSDGPRIDNMYILSI